VERHIPRRFYCKLTERTVDVIDHIATIGGIGQSTGPNQWIGGKCKYSQGCLMNGLDCMYVLGIGNNTDPENPSPLRNMVCLV